jgi:isoleucyl-tRNA synthetase
LDQTRGWFYSLHALSTLLFDQTSYRNVICLGLILDEQGDKMSKSKGNVVDPWEVVRAHGADPLRWYLFTATAPGNARRFSSNLVGETVRRFFLTLWNTYSFFVTYANIDSYNPTTAPQVEPTSELDRWILSELNALVAQVTSYLDEYNPTDAGRRIEEFVEELSNWYVRRSRRRFWKSENDQDKASAYATLYRCLTTLSHLLAPFTPFLAEEMYQNLVRSVDSQAPESVHLADWPAADTSMIDEGLSEAMRLAMKVASLGRAARNKAKVRVRQPLSGALVLTRTRREEEGLQRISDLLTDELNVEVVEVLKHAGQVVDFQVQANMALLGPKYGARARQIAEELISHHHSPQNIANSVLAGSGYTIHLISSDRASQPITIDLLPEEITLRQEDKPGFAVATEGGYTVAVRTELTPELRDEGFARELVHRIQNLRRSAGFDIADHITLWHQGSPRTHQVMENEKLNRYIRQETLADQVVEGTPDASATTETFKLEGEEVTLGVRRG